jgi:hypothetical protein
MFNQKLCSNNFYSKIQKFYLSSQAKSYELNPYYVTGFTDGEGCFFIGVSPNSNYKTNFRVKTIFQIGVHIKDIALLEKIKLYFNVGHISKLGEESVQYRVSSLKDLKVILQHFEEFPLLTYKQSDFLLFKEAVKIIEDGEHLTSEGLNRIMSIKAALNSKEISDQFKFSFPNLIPALKPKIKEREIKSLH